MSVIDTLIFDRTPEDVANRTKKGYYNAEDLNRVRSAMEYVRDVFNEYGYSVVLSAQRVWAEGDIPTVTEMENYLNDLRVLRSILVVLEDTPEAPDGINQLTYQKANDIEEILWGIADALRRLSLSATVPCGASECGGDYF